MQAPAKKRRRKGAHSAAAQLHDEPPFGGLRVRVDPPSQLEYSLALAAIGASITFAIWLLTFTLQHIGKEEHAYYQWWLLFALITPLTYVYQKIYDKAMLLHESYWWFRVNLDSMSSKELYTAVLYEIQKVAEAQHATASTDVEAFTEYDRNHGITSIQMRGFGTRPKTLRLRLPDEDGHVRELRAHFNRGDDIVCGRDHAVQRRDWLSLRLASSGDVPKDRELLKRWMKYCMKLYNDPPDDVVEVIALDQSSVDWVPEWKTRCVRRMKRTDGAGQSFFLQRPSARPLLADACTWFGKELRCYLITGPPGTGKTELTVWLAGHFRVPLYRVSLNDPRLSDQLLAQLISPTALKHDNVVIQIDEFQETLTRWRNTGDEAKGVSMGGFCEILQGSNSLSRGFIVLSGTSQLADLVTDPVYAAVFRRIVVTTTLGALSKVDVQTFAQRFIADFVPDCASSEVRRWVERFAGRDTPWGRGHISIDMVKQFLMKRISCFRAQHLSHDEILSPDVRCEVPQNLRDLFAAYLCDATAAEEFLSAYPPVNGT